VLNFEETDEQLLERYAQGDAQAFELFFVRHRGRVYHYALKKLQRPEVASEIVQDVFLKLHAKIHQYRSGEPALSWFFTIVHNACVDEARRWAKATQVMHSTDYSAEQIAAAPDASAAQEADVLSALGHSLDQLSLEQRSLLEQRIMQGKSFRQISHESGKNEVALRKVYSRGIEKIRRWFAALDDKEDGQ